MNPALNLTQAFFQNRFHVLHIIFLNFIKEQMNIFLNVVPIQVLIDFSVLTVLHLSLLFPGPVHLDLSPTP